MDLDELRSECRVIKLGNYWVLFGERLEHPMVIKIDTLLESCYYCCFETTGRSVVMRGGKVVLIEAVCAYCYRAIERLPKDAASAAVLEACWRVRAHRVGEPYRGVGRCVDDGVRNRKAIFPALIARARQALPPEAQPAKPSIDELLADVAELLDEE